MEARPPSGRLPEPLARPATPARVGPYAIEAELGRGGAGVVYRARHGQTGAVHALKVLLGNRLEKGKTERAFARFRREAEVMARVDAHPGVVRIHAVGAEGNVPWCAMEMVAGRSLADRLAERGPLPPEEAARLVVGVARAVDFCHGHGVVHRDLKPENVLIDAEGRPKVADFGLAYDAFADRLTRTGEFLGTPAYMAPEQVARPSGSASGSASGAPPGDASEGSGEDGAVGRSADVYGVGAILYAALTGHAPFEASQSAALVYAIMQNEPVEPRRHLPELPPELEAICLHAIEKEPTERYGTAGALADDLERWLAGEPVRAPVRGRVQRAMRRWARGRRGVVASATIAAGLLLVLLLGAGGGALLLRSRRRAAASSRLNAESVEAAVIASLLYAKLALGSPIGERTIAPPPLPRATLETASRSLSELRAALDLARASDIDAELIANDATTEQILAVLIAVARDRDGTTRASEVAAAVPSLDALERLPEIPIPWSGPVIPDSIRLGRVAIGRALAESGDLDRGSRLLGAVAKSTSARPLLRADALLVLARHADDEAERRGLLDEAEAAGGSNVALPVARERARSLARSGRTKDALAIATPLFSDTAEHHFVRASVFEERGRFDLVLVELDGALAANSSHADAAEARVRSLLRTADEDRAAAARRELPRLAANADRRARAVRLRLAATVAAARGRADEAKRDEARAAELVPSTPRATLALTETLTRGAIARSRRSGDAREHAAAEALTDLLAARGGDTVPMLAGRLAATARQRHPRELADRVRAARGVASQLSGDDRRLLARLAVAAELPDEAAALLDAGADADDTDDALLRARIDLAAGKPASSLDRLGTLALAGAGPGATTDDARRAVEAAVIAARAYRAIDGAGSSEARAGARRAIEAYGAWARARDRGRLEVVDRLMRRPIIDREVGGYLLEHAPAPLDLFKLVGFSVGTRDLPGELDPADPAALAAACASELAAADKFSAFEERGPGDAKGRPEHESAERLASAVVAVRPASGIALIYRGWVRLGLGRTDEAKADTERGMRLDPSGGIHLPQLGIILANRDGPTRDAFARIIEGVGYGHSRFDLWEAVPAYLRAVEPLARDERLEPILEISSIMDGSHRGDKRRRFPAMLDDDALRARALLATAVHAIGWDMPGEALPLLEEAERRFDAAGEPSPAALIGARGLARARHEGKKGAEAAAVDLREALEATPILTEPTLPPFSDLYEPRVFLVRRALDDPVAIAGILADALRATNRDDEAAAVVIDTIERTIDASVLAGTSAP